MKLCPQCAFIYEDHQRVCDMDGQELVNAPAPAPKSAPVPEQISAPISFAPEPQLAPTRLTISLPAKPASSPAPSPTASPASSSRRLAVLVILLVVLATLFSVLVMAQVRRARSNHAVQPPQPEQSMATESKPQRVADLKPASSVGVSALSEPSPESPEESAPANAVAPSLTRARSASGPVSAAATGANSRSVILRLTNGAIINADEVWERKEGIWYQQAGMVTFINRNRVRSIERVAAPRAQEQTATNVDANSKKSAGRPAQNQLRLRRLEAVETKKPSRVKSFLKLTGRILKKPFKL